MCQICDEGEEKPATWRCDDGTCEHFFCDACNADEHAAKQTKKHVRTPVVAQTAVEKVIQMCDICERDQPSAATWRCDEGSCEHFFCDECNNDEHAAKQTKKHVRTSLLVVVAVEDDGTFGGFEEDEEADQDNTQGGDEAFDGFGGSTTAAEFSATDSSGFAALESEVAEQKDEVFECDFDCGFDGTASIVEEHEMICASNPAIVDEETDQRATEIEDFDGFNG